MSIAIMVSIWTSLFAACQPGEKLMTTDSTDFQLVWQDEFEKDGPPDPGKWRFESGFVRNEEAQWYQADNAVCRNGFLVITGKREQKPNPVYQPGSRNWKNGRRLIEYTSASVVMHKEHAFRYGRLEVRAKIDAQTGLWPAIWTVGLEGAWPSNGEIDIMEYYNNGILANFAIADTGKSKPIWDGSFHRLDSLGGKAWAQSFHTWTMDWDEHSIEIRVDGALLNRIDTRNTFNKSDGKNPFQQPHYLLLNLAMGGNRGGSLEHTVLPSEYLVDYVRLYQKQPPP
jgi:beta-glucanase (GH16 family)